jgi:hypothetical protein
MMVLFQYWDFLRTKDLDLHNLAVKKASSLLLISLDYLYQITCKYTCGITTSSKRKSDMGMKEEVKPNFRTPPR